MKEGELSGGWILKTRSYWACATRCEGPGVGEGSLVRTEGSDALGRSAMVGVISIQGEIAEKDLFTERDKSEFYPAGVNGHRSVRP